MPVAVLQWYLLLENFSCECTQKLWLLLGPVLSWSFMLLFHDHCYYIGYHSTQPRSNSQPPILSEICLKDVLFKTTAAIKSASLIRPITSQINWFNDTYVFWRVQIFKLEWLINLCSLKKLNSTSLIWHNIIYTDYVCLLCQL